MMEKLNVNAKAIFYCTHFYFFNSGKTQCVNSVFEYVACAQTWSGGGDCGMGLVSAECFTQKGGRERPQHSLPAKRWMQPKRQQSGTKIQNPTRQTKAVQKGARWQYRADALSSLSQEA